MDTDKKTDVAANVGEQRVVMPLSELQDICASLANSCHVRYWIHWNRPMTNPWLMAVECICPPSIKGVKAQGMEERGFTWNEHDERFYIERDTSDMTPEAMMI